MRWVSQLVRAIVLGTLVGGILAGLATPTWGAGGSVQIESYRSQPGTGRGYWSSGGDWRSPSGRGPGRGGASPYWGHPDGRPYDRFGHDYPWYRHHYYYYGSGWGSPAWPPAPPVWVPGQWVWNGWGWVWQPGYWW